MTCYTCHREVPKTYPSWTPPVIEGQPGTVEQYCAPCFDAHNEEQCAQEQTERNRNRGGAA